jgi:hypothetical protein
MAMFHVVSLCLRLLYVHGALDFVFETIIILCLMKCFGYCPCFGGCPSRGDRQNMHYIKNIKYVCQ